MQLVAYGAQDVYLTGNPQITFFKQLYRRHSNFAMESIEQTFNGVGNFGKRVQSTISRNGNMPQESSITAAASSISPSSRERRAAPTVAAVLDTMPPNNPVVSVPARVPSIVCAR